MQSKTNKVYTDHPLMDEMVFNCKKILNEIVIKNDVLADNYETKESLEAGEILLSIKNKTMSFISFPFTLPMLLDYGYGKNVAISYLNNRDLIPEAERDSLLEFCYSYYLDNYEETNDYYRSLAGLPAYKSGNRFYIMISSSDFPSDYNTEDLNLPKPIHELNSDCIEILRNNGVVDKLINSNKGFYYSYLRYLGNRSIDYYSSRIADKWQILYLPSVERLVEDRFIELYNANREIYLKRTYQESFTFNSDYYDQLMIIILLAQTFNDMIVDIPEWYIRRDIFDIRSVQYYLESSGVEFFKIIPLKYQISIVKNLNKLIYYKSTNKNFQDILDLFGLDNTKIYKYYLYKKRLIDGVSYKDNNLSEENKYDLEFIQTEMNDSYDNYIKDQIYRTKYDDITYEDKYWDGEDEHSYIKQQHLLQDFTIARTKYMSVEYINSLEDYNFQMKYFLGLLFDSTVDISDIKMPVPSIKDGVEFKLSDLFLFLYLVSNAYDGLSTEVITPDKFIYGNTLKAWIPDYNDNVYSGEYNTDNETYWGLEYGQNIHSTEREPLSDTVIGYIEPTYDWMKWQYIDRFKNERDRVYAFNNIANLDKLSNDIAKNHSNFGFAHGYTLKDLGVDTFKQTNGNKISSIDDLMDLYNTNKKCYYNLMNYMNSVVDSRDDLVLCNFVYKELFTKKFSKNDYSVNGNYVNNVADLLKGRDYILYNLYKTLSSNLNEEEKKDSIRDIVNDIVDTLEYYLNYDGLEYIFAFTPIASFSALINYMYLMINFFKSYKVYFLEPYSTYISNDKFENYHRAADAITERKLTFWKTDKQFTRDNMNKNVTKELSDNYRDTIVETLDIYGHFDPDPDDDYDYNGMKPDSGDTGYKEANGSVPDDNKCIPYIMINCGHPWGEMINIWDLDGGTSKDPLEFIEVNGGKPMHIDDWQTDYWGTAFNYIIDAGRSSTNQFITKSLITKVIDRQISSEIRVSTAVGQEIVNKEDGIYIEDKWITYDKFSDLKNESNEEFAKFDDFYNSLSEDLLVLTDDSALEARINKCMGHYLDGLNLVYSNIHGDNFENSIKINTDNYIDTLKQEYSGYNTFAWEDI